MLEFARALVALWERLVGRLGRSAANDQRLTRLERDMDRQGQQLAAAAGVTGQLQEVDARLKSMEERVEALSDRCANLLAAVARLEGLWEGWSPPYPPSGRRRKGR
jgi:chromosome segregation ATPase